MQHILFISYDGMTDPLGQSQVIPYLAGLTKYGYRFSILSCDKPDKYKTHQQEVRSMLNGLPIQWHSIPYHKNPPVLSSVYDFWQMKKAIRQMQKNDPVDMVHTRPGLPALLGVWMKKKFGTKFLNDIRGFWADERVDGGMWNLSNPLYKGIYRFFKRKEDEAIRLADFNTCLTEKARREILSWKQVPQPVRLEVIPCSVDMCEFDPAAINLEDQEVFRKEMGIGKTDLVVSYLGSIGGWYLTKEMMQCCKAILDAHTHARFLFISNNRHELIRSIAAEYDIPADRIITRFARRHELPAILSLSQYSLFFIKPCYSKISSSPTKQAEIMALGIPVITNAGVGDVDEIVRTFNAGFILPDFSAGSMEKLSLQLNTSNGFDSTRIRQGAFTYFDLEKAVEKYAGVYRQIFSK